MVALFDTDELGDWLQQEVTAPATTAVERVVWGWLRPVLGLAERPLEPSEELFAWAIELGGIAHENPAGLDSYSLGAERQRFSSERRAEVLAMAANSGRLGSPRPVGRFPSAHTYPDPARPDGR